MFPIVDQLNGSGGLHCSREWGQECSLGEGLNEGFWDKALRGRCSGGPPGRVVAGARGRPLSATGWMNQNRGENQAEPGGAGEKDQRGLQKESGPARPATEETHSQGMTPLPGTGGECHYRYQGKYEIRMEAFTVVEHKQDSQMPAVGTEEGDCSVWIVRRRGIPLHP
ncbi:hypothetical protein DPEC_G00267600 [Dallia pectoralis]|uniref:Uncharacterized protein n=1 Tax=Dallia pectoralis TaxID=75939 RepID=A0ACC2FNS2_DALPE|nr:hypothetical protein DPEC_G00267600 [Dallia pectoralis]